MNVLVTGASRGLGLEFVKQYAEEGATVFACCRDPRTSKPLKRIADEAGGKVSLHGLDVGDEHSIARLAEAFGDAPLDLLINNAGIYGPKNQSADNMDFPVWAETFLVNTMAPLRVAQAFRRNLKAGRDKKLITITSGMGSTAYHSGDYFAYRSSKAAVNNVMHGLALAWKDDDIIVALIHPGWVKTDMGGPNATLEPHQSITGMRKVIERLTTRDSGKFLDYSGKELPW
ncbi:MAG TPA: SDR family oxidoreductase [Rhizomicrobium sp.]|nr:SDR family oxidoreductase [Rhizomicrobium sp.]